MATKADKSRQKKQLSLQQGQAIGLLLLGKTDEAVAAEIGMCRQTVNSWQHNDSLFAAELNWRRQEVLDSISDKMRAMLLSALDVLAVEIERRDVQTAMALVRLCRVDLSKIGPVDAAEVEGDRLMHATMVGGRLALAKLDV